MKTLLTALAVLLAAVAAGRAEVSLKIGDATAAAGGTFGVPVLISGSQTIGSIQFVVDYDPRLLEPMVKAGEESKAIAFGKALSGAALEHNAKGAGEWKIALVPDEVIAQDGELLRLHFRVKGKPGESCILTLDQAMAWEKESLFEVPLVVQFGTVTITGSRLPPWWALLVGAIALAVMAAAVFVFLQRKRAATPANESSQPPPSAPPPLPTA